ncbi:hypothetical protein HY643_03605 [Candidatus Woesearchaeota archaeon]|nr:hypothetical protein [Candidatus Woesearchaeota archaeon]
MRKKGQAAMEFLMTYGWAILVVLIAIGALAYFGVLSPERFLPSSCTLVPGLGCGEFKVTSSVVTMGLTNGFGTDLTVNGLTLTPAGGSAVTAAGTNCLATNTISDGATSTCTFSGMTNVGRFKGTISFNYTKSGETLSHVATGTLVSKVE